jgi:hypothetical protein
MDKIKFLEPFLYPISGLHTSSSESTHLIFPKLPLLRHLVILNTSSFPLISRMLPRNSRLWWTHSWAITLRFCLPRWHTDLQQERVRTRRTPSTSAENPERRQVACKAGKMKVLPEVRWVFGPHYLLRPRSTFPRQAHCCLELANIDKREDAAVIPAMCEVLPTIHPQFCSNCFTFDKMLLIIWEPVLKNHNLSRQYESRLTLLATPLVLCWMKNILMAGTQ